MLSVFSTSTGNIGVDGYFTSFPENSTVLLRRVSNGQPAMIMYPFGKGYVIATTLYTDFALTHHQANQTEINFIQNIISWAKKPKELMDVRPGEIVNLNLDVTNFTDVDTTSIKITVLDPSRKVVNEKTQNISIGPNQSLTIPFTHTSTTTSTLGVYHIDYTLLDSQGNIIQPQAETDSGRFAVSKPPKTQAQINQITFSIQSDAEHYLMGDAVTLTILAFNSSDVERMITAKFGGQNRVMVVPAKGASSFVYLKTAQSDYNHWGQWWGMEWVSFYEETKMIGASMKLYRVYPLSANVSVRTDKTAYAKGENVAIGISLKNNINFTCRPNVKITVWDSKWTKVFEDLKTSVLTPYGTDSVSTNFTLPSNSTMGRYEVYVQILSGSGYAYTRFELLQSQISVSPNLPSGFNMGTNTIPFAITNTGKVNVNSGTLDLSLKAPDGSVVYSGSQPFSIVVGESKTLEIPISISSLNFGNYTLIYTQSDETKAGSPTHIIIPNSIAFSPSLDKPSYRIRGTANLRVDLKNTGKFNLENISLNVSVPDINYIDTKTLSLGVNPNATSLDFEIPIPETTLPGLHRLEVAATLPSGSRLTKTASLNVPESALSISYSVGANLRGGDLINVNITNTGGVDTGINYMATLTGNGVALSRNTGDDSLQPGQTKAFSLQIPFQAVAVSYTHLTLPTIYSV